MLFVVGLATALWSASAYVGAFMRAANIVYETPEGRPFWKVRPLQILVTLVMLVLLALVAVALVLTGPIVTAVAGPLGIGSTAVSIWDIAKWPVLLAVMVTTFAVLFYSAPNASRRLQVGHARCCSPSSWAGRVGGVRVLRGQLGSTTDLRGTLGAWSACSCGFGSPTSALLLGMELNSDERSRELADRVPGADRSGSSTRPRPSARRPPSPVPSSPVHPRSEGGVAMATQSPSGSATDNAKEQVQEKAQDAQEKLKGGAQQAQARMRAQVDQRSTQAGEQVNATAEALRTTSRQLRDQGQDAPAQATEKVAHHAERLGGYLSESNADRILDDLEDFAAASRWPCRLGGCRILASRFLKAPSRERYQGRTNGGAGTDRHASGAHGRAAAPAATPSTPLATPAAS